MKDGSVAAPPSSSVHDTSVHEPGPDASSARAMAAGWSAAAVTVPHAIGLGLLAFAPLAASHSLAALALWSAALPGLLLTLLLPRAGVVYAPTTVVALLFAAVLGQAAAVGQGLGLVPGQVLAVAGATVALAFVFQWVLGVLRMATLARFLPISVTHGFAAGVGLSMVLGQVRQAWGAGTWADERWLWHGLVAALVAGLAWVLQKRWPTRPGLMAAVVLVSAGLWPWGGMGWWPVDAVTSLVPSVASGTFAGPLWPQWTEIPWPAVLAQQGAPLVLLALLMALVNSLEILVFHQEMELDYGLRGDANQALRMESLLGALCAMAGMIPASTSASRSRIVLAQAVPSTLAPRVHAVIMLGVALTGVVWLPWVPLAALAGGLVLAGLWQVPALMWSPAYARRSWATWAQSWLVALVFAVEGGVVALVAGLVVAMFVLLRESAATVLRHVRLDGELRSRRLRRVGSESWIAPRMNQVAVFELQGVMSFGVAAHVAQEVRRTLAPRHRWVVLDAGRVPAWDSTSMAQLRALVRDLEQDGVATAVAALDATARNHTGDGVRVFADVDRALEWAEAGILSQRPLHQRPHYPAREVLGELGEGVPAAARAALQALARSQEVPAGTVVFHAGDTDRDLLIVTAGHITLCTQWPAEQGLRLATIGPGMAFGEMAFLNGAPRTACAGTERGHAKLLRLTRPDFDAWSRAHPDAALVLMSNLAQMGTRRLAATTRQLRAVLE